MIGFGLQSIHFRLESRSRNFNQNKIIHINLIGTIAHEIHKLVEIIRFNYIENDSRMLLIKLKDIFQQPCLVHIFHLLREPFSPSRSGLFEDCDSDWQSSICQTREKESICYVEC